MVHLRYAFASGFALVYGICMECEQFLKLVVAAIVVCVARMLCAMLPRIAVLRCLGGPGL